MRLRSIQTILTSRDKIEEVSLGLSRISRVVVFVLAIQAGAGRMAWADATITVNGNLSDWPANAFTFYDVGSDMPPPYADIVRVRATNDNTAGSNGNLFLAIEFLVNFRPNVGGNDVDVYVYLDLDGDGVIGGPFDRVLEVTEGAVTDGNGNPVGTIGAMAFAGTAMEVAIPYAVLGLSHGSDAFGLAFQTAGHPGGNVDRSPEAGQGDGGFIQYDGTTGDDVEPLAVRMTALFALADRDGVTVRWSTGSERSNAGFHAYRLDRDGRRVRLTGQLVPGLVDAALGRDYAFSDPGGLDGDRYVVEDWDLKGGSRGHGPIPARFERAQPQPTSAALGAGGRVPESKDRRGPGLSRFKPRFKPLAGGSFSLVKLGVREEGLNAVRFDRLAAAGLDPVAVQRNGLRLERAAGLVPVLARTEGFFFVGTPERDRYADLEVLTAGAGESLVLAERRVRGKCRNSLSTVADELLLEENRIYYVATPTADPFFWSVAFEGSPAELGFDLLSAPALPDRGVSPGPASIRIFVAGVASREGPDHRLAVWLNETLLGEASWEGRGMEELAFPVAAGLLRERNNLVRIALLPTSAVDVVFADRIVLSYQHKLRAEGGAIGFRAPAGRCLKVDRLGGKDVVLLDVTDSHRPVLLRGFGMLPGSDGAWSLVFRDDWHGRGPTAPVRRYLVATPALAAEPLALGPLQARDLSSSGHAADYLVITHPDFRQAANRMADFHGREFRTMVVTTEEVYDTFNHGRPSPKAIRNLLEVARANWNTAPTHVLLVGGATVDSNGVLGGGEAEYLPAPFWVTTGYGYEAAADGWYVAGPDGITPTAAIGRLAVRDSQEAEQVVDKILAWEAAPPRPSGRMLFVVDRGTGAVGGEGGRFETWAEALIETCLPAGVIAERLLVRNGPDPRSQLAAFANEGVDAVHFLGHAYLEGWSSPPIVTTSEAGLFGNALPFLLFSWSCFDGAFVGPWGEALAWAFVSNPGGGALAALASSTLTDPAAVEALAEQTLCLLTSGRAATVGAALREAKEILVPLGAAFRDAVLTFNLLGDPATPSPYFRGRFPGK